jgi:hypothetical protein
VISDAQIAHRVAAVGVWKERHHFDDALETHYVHSKAHGARIVEEIWQHGARAYEAADLEGHHWTFAQASLLMRWLSGARMPLASVSSTS